MTQPIEKLLDTVKWEVLESAPTDDDGFLPFATHSGVLEIAGHKLRCHRLNTGMTVINAEDLEAFFGEFPINAP